MERREACSPSRPADPSACWGPPEGLIAGNNALGVALVMLVPFMYYLFQTSTRRYLRHGMVFLIAMTFLAILGTQSRGAFLALAVMGLFVGLKGKRPLLTTSIIGVVLVAAIGFMPSTWTSRMNTIESYDEDSSAMSRVYTWKTLWALALDRPLVGAGFNAAIPIVFATYAPRDMGNFDFRNTVLVAHSIYFQALGEHGFSRPVPLPADWFFRVAESQPGRCQGERGSRTRWVGASIDADVASQLGRVCRRWSFFVIGLLRSSLLHCRLRGSG
jgi:hypothetical protein